MGLGHPQVGEQEGGESAAPCQHSPAKEVGLLSGFNLGSFLCRLVLPIIIRSSSLAGLKQRSFKIGGCPIQHARVFNL